MSYISSIIKENHLTRIKPRQFDCLTMHISMDFFPLSPALIYFALYSCSFIILEDIFLVFVAVIVDKLKLLWHSVPHSRTPTTSKQKFLCKHKNAKWIQQYENIILAFYDSICDNRMCRNRLRCQSSIRCYGSFHSYAHLNICCD